MVSDSRKAGTKGSGSQTTQDFEEGVTQDPSLGSRRGVLVICGRDPTSHMDEDGILCLHHGEGTVGRQWDEELWDWEGPSGGLHRAIVGVQGQGTPPMMCAL